MDEDLTKNKDVTELASCLPHKIVGVEPDQYRIYRKCISEKPLLEQQIQDTKKVYSDASKPSLQSFLLVFALGALVGIASDRQWLR